MEKSTQTTSPILSTPPEAQNEPLEPLRGSAVNESCEEAAAQPKGTSAVISVCNLKPVSSEINKALCNLFRAVPDDWQEDDRVELVSKGGAS